MSTLILLVACFYLKHFLADYIFQTHYHLGKFQPGPGFIIPLADHCLIHAVSTGLLLACFSAPKALIPWAVTFDFFSHFLMDRLKSGPQFMGRWKPSSAKTLAEFDESSDKDRRGNQLFWWSLGLDQMWHHLSDLFIISVVIFQ